MTAPVSGSFLSSLLVLICTWIANEDPGDNEFSTELLLNHDSVVFEGRANSSVVIVLNCAVLDLTEEFKDSLSEAIVDAICDFCEASVCVSTNTTLTTMTGESVYNTVLVNPKAENDAMTGLAIVFFIRSSSNSVLEKEYVMGAVRQSQSEIEEAIGHKILSVDYFSKTKWQQGMHWHDTKSWLTLPVFVAINLLILAICSIGTMGLYITMIVIRAIMQKINSCIMYNSKLPTQVQPEL